MELAKLKLGNGLYVLSIIVAASLWGVDGVLLTPKLYGLPVALVVLIMHTIPFLLMSPYFISCHFSKLRELLTSRYFFSAFSVSLFGGALGTLAIVKALFLVNFDHLSIVVMLQKLQPIFALLLARVILKEKLSRSFIAYAALAMVASYLLTFGLKLPRLDQDAPLLMASFYSLVAAASFGASTVLGRQLVTHFPFPIVHFTRFFLTTLIMLGVVSLFGEWSKLPSVETSHWLIFLLIAFTTGSGAVFLYYFGLQKVRASVSTICELFFPLTAIVLDYFIYGHALTSIQWLGALLLLFSIIKIAFLIRR